MASTVISGYRYPAHYSKGFAYFLIVLGVLAVLLPFLAGLAIVSLLGWFVLVSGVVYLIHAFDHRGGHSVWGILLGVLYTLGGLYLVLHPGISLVTLTLWLAILFLLEGVFELVAYFASPVRSSWGLINAIVTLVLALLVWRGWPASAAWALGTIVGVNLIFSGIARLNSRRAVVVA